MTVKVGDTVRVLCDDFPFSAPNGSTQVVCEAHKDSYIKVSGNDGWGYVLATGEYEPTTETTITEQIRARMEDHMGKGEYARAVKWALLAEQVEALENE